MSLASEMYEAQQHHGATSRGLCIPDTGVHRARLQLAAEMLMDHDVADVLDLGCGFGELADLLDTDVRYVGVDQTLWILALAREQRSHRRFVQSEVVDFLVNSRSAQHDAVVALGVMVTMPQDAIGQLLRLMGATASKLVIVSFQDARYYRGKLFAHHLRDVEALLGPCSVWRKAAGDTEITALFGP
jgi:ubiquinone/menaquinone biosynthesis C-methylase UbiE